MPVSPAGTTPPTTTTTTPPTTTTTTPTPIDGTTKAGTRNTPIGGIIDEAAIDKAVARTKINGGATSDFDPDMFLKLLSAQLKNQSPFDTVETDQIVQQQAVIAQVEQSAQQTKSIKELNTTLKTELQGLKLSIREIRDFIITGRAPAVTTSQTTSTTGGN
ncbi:MAG: flagellar hook capping FlgD N-terminal domain-containing protein [bacterium]